jgi:tetratricopeptide (TPR) repeat protein
MALAPAVLSMPSAFGLQAAAQSGQATWKDQAESDLYQSMSKETDPQKKIDLFEQWKGKYPSSQMGQYFVPLYFGAIQAINGPVAALFAAPSPSADQQAAAQKSAEYLSSHLDTLFGADRKPSQIGDADWAKAKKDMSQMVGNVPGYIAMAKKDYPAAEAAFAKSLQDDPAQSQSGNLAYWLAGMYFQEKKYTPSMYYYARAASYDGPGSLNAQGRQQVQASLEKTYVAYHGSKDGLDQLLATAKTTPTPPADFKILSKRELAQAKLDQENADKEKLAKANPSMALWVSIKEALTGDQAQSYFDEHMKGTAIPVEFKGKLIEAKPALNPKELILAIADGTTPDATLKFETALRGKMEPGAEIGFKEGVATAYTANPFMVSFDVEKEKLTGWKGAPAPPPAKRARKKQ